MKEKRKIIKLVNKIKIAKGSENLSEYIGKELGGLLNQLLKLCSEQKEDKTEKIKPCPFCGGKKIEIIRTNPCWIRCYNCGADAPSNESRKIAINIWNKRPRIEGFAKIIIDGDKIYKQYTST